MGQEGAWGATLAAALVGAERAQAQVLPEPLADLAAAGDPGGDLLARIGALGTYHLAGAGLAPDALKAFAPLAIVAPECPQAAGLRLATLLSEGASANAHVHEWCRLAAERGVRAPAELMPLLDLRRGTASEAEAIDPVAGTELEWLRRVCAGEEAQPVAAEPAEAATEEKPAKDWTEGDAAGRRWVFAAFRRRDPDAARAALEEAFKGEKADLRAHFVEAFEMGLGPADEPFLEACLDDRAGGVRSAAQRLLGYLPGSRFKQRMAERVGTALRITATRKLLGATKHELEVVLPTEAPDLVRDGIEPSTYAKRQGGPGADRLAQILRLAPLSAYPEHPPRVWVEAALRSDWSGPIVDGMVTALRRERDPAWRDAVIGTLRDACAQKLTGVKPNGEIQDALAKATAVLSAPDWEQAVGAVLRTKDLDITLRLLADGPATFSPAFTAAILDWLGFVLRGHGFWLEALARASVIPRLGYRCEPSPEAAAKAADLLATSPDKEEMRWLRNQLATLSDTLTLRAAMRREFS